MWPSDAEWRHKSRSTLAYMLGAVSLPDGTELISLNFLLLQVYVANDENFTKIKTLSFQEVAVVDKQHLFPNALSCQRMFLS